MTVQDLDDTVSPHLTSAESPKIISNRNFLTDFKLFPLPRITKRNRLLKHLGLEKKRAFFPSNRSPHNQINPQFTEKQFLRHCLSVTLFWLQLLSKSGHQSLDGAGGATGWIVPLPMIFRSH